MRDREKAGSVTKRPVTELMSKNCDDFLRLGLFNQGIVDNNVLLPRKTEEVSIAVGAALASVNNVKLREWELELLSKCLNGGLELSIWQRRECIEQRQDGAWVDGNHEDLKSGTKSPQVEKELVASLLNDLEESGENWWGKDPGEHLRLGHVRGEDLGSLLVKTELLLKNKSAVNRGWQGDNRLNGDES